MTNAFSDWTSWPRRATLDHLEYPGVYVLAISREDFSGTPFSWLPEIVCIGMSNAKGGLKSRLQQFDRTVKTEGVRDHNPARRVRAKYTDYASLTSRLYVAVCSRKCRVKSQNPADLRIMGDVAKHEFECLAVFVERFGRLPEFNDRKTVLLAGSDESDTLNG